MTRTICVIFDGEVLRPEEPLDLRPNRRYEVTIEEIAGGDGREPGVLDDILDLAADFDLPPDFAAQHDHYLCGTPKR
jgi:hypothetical protein